METFIKNPRGISYMLGAFSWKFLAVLVFLVLSDSAVALTLNTPDQLPASINWSFSIELDATDSFDETQVFIDGAKAVTIYPTGIYALDAFNGKLVDKVVLIDTNPAATTGLTAYVSYLGLPAGSHKIKAAGYKGGAEISSQEKEVNVYVAASMGTVQRVEEISKSTSERLEEVRKSSAELLDTINAAKLSYVELKTKIEEIEKNLASVAEQAENADEQTKTTVKTVQTELAEVKTRVIEEEQKLTQAEQTAATSTAPTGYAGLAGGTWLAVGVGLVVGLMILGFLAWHVTAPDEATSVFSRDESVSAAAADNETALNEAFGASSQPQTLSPRNAEITQIETKGKFGKWAHASAGHSQKPPAEKKRFRLGDLIKK